MGYQNLKFNLFVILLIQILSVNSVYIDKEFKIGSIAKLDLQNCSKIIFRTSYKKVNLEISSAHDVTAVLFTDKEISLGSCGNVDLFEKCKEDADICAYSTNISTQLAYETGFCTDVVYLYVEVASNEASLTIQANKIEIDENSKQHACNKIPDSDQNVYCGSKSSLSCKSNCIIGCKYLSCQEDKKEQFGLCVPSFFDSKQDALKTCQMSYGIDAYEEIDNCDSFLKEGEAEIREHPFVIYLAFLLLIWIFSIWFYNYKLEKTGEPPFPVFCCPEICYPRKRLPMQNTNYFQANDGNNNDALLQPTPLLDDDELKNNQQEQKSQILNNLNSFNDQDNNNTNVNQNLEKINNNIVMNSGFEDNSKVLNQSNEVENIDINSNNCDNNNNENQLSSSVQKQQKDSIKSQENDQKSKNNNQNNKQQQQQYQEINLSGNSD